MPIICQPLPEHMPLFIDGLKHGHRLDNQAPKSPQEISAIEENAETFFRNFLEQKTKDIPPDDPGASPIKRSEFWCLGDGFFIGRLNIRHGLNQKLLQHVGNIGFEVAPAHQRKGHATTMLQWALDFCRNHTDLSKVLLTTAESNDASIKLIEKNGGILENKIERPDGTPGRRYWIIL